MNLTDDERAFFEAANEEVEGERVVKFVVESNRIEGVRRDPTAAEVQAHAEFLALDGIILGDVMNLAKSWPAIAVSFATSPG